MQEQDKIQKSTGNSGCLRPAIAVIGFFVFFFLTTFLVYHFRVKWLIPVGLVVAFAWAIFFSMDTIKEKVKNKNKNDEEET